MSIYKKGGGAAAVPSLELVTLKDTVHKKLSEFGASATPGGNSEWAVTLTEFSSSHAECTALYKEDGFKSGSKKKGEKKERATTNEDRSTTALNISAIRTKKVMRSKVLMMKADRLITCTTRDPIRDRSTFEEITRKFFRKMRNVKEGFQYVAVFEMHNSRKTSDRKLKSYHLHIATRGYFKYNEVRQAWEEAVRSTIDLEDPTLTAGNIDVQKPLQATAHNSLARYLAKYLLKDIASGDVNKKRYWSSRNIEEPEKFTFYISPALHPIYVIQQIVEHVFGKRLTNYFRPELEGGAPPVIWLTNQ